MLSSVRTTETVKYNTPRPLRNITDFAEKTNAGNIGTFLLPWPDNTKTSTSTEHGKTGFVYGADPFSRIAAPQQTNTNPQSQHDPNKSTCVCIEETSSRRERKKRKIGYKLHTRSQETPPSRAHPSSFLCAYTHTRPPVPQGLRAMRFADGRWIDRVTEPSKQTARLNKNIHLLLS